MNGSDLRRAIDAKIWQWAKDRFIVFAHDDQSALAASLERLAINDYGASPSINVDGDGALVHTPCGCEPDLPVKRGPDGKARF